MLGTTTLEGAVMYQPPFTRTQVAKASGKTYNEIKQMIREGALVAGDRGITDSAVRDVFGDDVLTTLRAQCGRDSHPTAM